MGFALPKPEFDDGVGLSVEPGPQILHTSYPGTISFPEREWHFPRLRLGVVGDFWNALTPILRRALSCCLLLGVLASLCAAVNLWSISTRTQFEDSRYSSTILDGKLSELKSNVPLYPIESGH